MEALPSVIAERHLPDALWLLSSIREDQRWGIAEAVPPGWRIYFKGGWGSEDGELDSQVALLTRDNHSIQLAVMTTDSPGIGYAHSSIEGVAQRLLHGL
jgi:beta-lactamase class A